MFSISGPESKELLSNDVQSNRTKTSSQSSISSLYGGIKVNNVINNKSETTSSKEKAASLISNPQVSISCGSASVSTDKTKYLNEPLKVKIFNKGENRSNYQKIPIEEPTSTTQKTIINGMVIKDMERNYLSPSLSAINSRQLVHLKIHMGRDHKLQFRFGARFQYTVQMKDDRMEKVKSLTFEVAMPSSNIGPLI